MNAHLSRGLHDVLEASEMLTLFASAKAHPGIDDAAAKSIHAKLVANLNDAMRDALVPLPPAPAEIDEDGNPVAPVDVASLQAELAATKEHVESLQAAQAILADELTAARAQLAGAATVVPDEPPPPPAQSPATPADAVVTG